jgi:hypothetical protein
MAQPIPKHGSHVGENDPLNAISIEIVVSDIQYVTTTV